MAVRGSSAGGYLTLCALTFHEIFKAGASYSGVADLRSLASKTHKFEAHYIDQLLGVTSREADDARYEERSPIHFSERLNAPIAFLQGADDTVVPSAQADIMANAMRARNIPYLYLLFDGEQHGFRRSESIARALEAELSLYAMFLTESPVRVAR
jgi:dipeptidyl aminopeptidase/acylaminoacyl peptidase